MRVSNHISVFMVTVSLIFYAWLLQACQEVNEQPTVEPWILDLPEIPKKTLPSYLNWVKPEPGTMEMVEAYNLTSEIYPNTEPSICFNLNPYPLAEPGDFLSVEEMFARISLKVNGELFAPADTVLSSGSSREGPPNPETGEPVFRSPGQAHQLCYVAKLDAGLHTVTFQYEHTSGKVTEFGWSFFLVETPEEAIEISRLPLFLWEVRPHPGEALLVREYESPETLETLMPAEPSICLSVDSGGLNDAFSWQVNSYENNALPWFTLEVNGTVVTESISTPFEEATTRSWYIVCYPVNLPLGVHTATFIIDPPSHEPITYSWPFLLVDEP